MNDLVDAARRYADFPGDAVLAQSHGFQELPEQHFAGVNIFQGPLKIRTDVPSGDLSCSDIFDPQRLISYEGFQGKITGLAILFRSLRIIDFKFFIILLLNSAPTMCAGAYPSPALSPTARWSL